MSESQNNVQEIFSYLATAPSSGTILIRNEGGYVARFKVQFKYNDKVITKDSGDFTAGVNKSIEIPSGATEIYLKVEEAWFIASWSTIFTKKYDEPVNKFFTISGTSLNPTWREN